MVSLTTTTRREGGVTLVECHLESDRPRRVRLTNRLDGPVWPPRRRGVPAAGWDEDGVTLTAAGDVGVGYATPAPPNDSSADEPAVDVTVEESATEPEAGPSGDGFATAFDVTPTADGVVRSLSDPRPPRNAIPTGENGNGHGKSRDDDSAVEVPSGKMTGRMDGVPRTGASSTAGAEQPESPGAHGTVPEPTPEAPTGEDGPGGTGTEPPPAVCRQRRAGDGPAPPDAWLSTVERRIELLEGVAVASTLPAATRAVAAAGGLDGVSDLAATVDDDMVALLAVARRAEALAGRAAATEPDVATLRRLA